MFGLSLLVFRDCLVDDSDGLVVAEFDAQGVVPVATFAVEDRPRGSQSG